MNIRDAGGAMKQPEDTRTPDLPGLDVPAKRGRGRPRKADALTPAQRAQRYRDRQKAAAAERETKRAAWAYKHLKQHPSRLAPAGVVIRYRGPNGETWTGRGLRPRWVTAAMENGYTLDDLEAMGDGP